MDNSTVNLVGEFANSRVSHKAKRRLNQAKYSGHIYSQKSDAAKQDDIFLKLKKK